MALGPADVNGSAGGAAVASRWCRQLRADAFRMRAEMRLDFRAASPERLASLMRNLLAANRTRWSIARRQPRRPRSCLATLPAHVCADLVGWLFVLSPQWGSPDLARRDPEASVLFKQLGRLLGQDKGTEFVHAFRIVTQQIVSPAGARVSGSEETEGCAQNPYEGASWCVPHHPVFRSFPPVHSRSPEGMVADFLGALHPANYYTHSGFERSLFPPTRTAAMKQHHEGTAATWPLIDEEYFQHVDVLASVLEAYRGGAEAFSVVELGTSFFAPWAVKAVTAWHRLVPGGACRVGLAEILEHEAAELRASLGKLGLGGCSAQVWSVDVGRTGLSALLGDFAAIDHLDLDIEGAELPVLMEARRFLKERVRRLHIGTHARYIHYELERALVDDGWEILWSFPNNAYTRTPYGRVAFLNGVLAAVSPELRWRARPQ